MSDYSTTAMQQPEMLLPEINKALRALRGAADVLADNEINYSLFLIMRQLLLAEILNEFKIIAVGGAQGAGKTTLVCALYDLPENTPWLPKNEGRGETLPVLVEEVDDTFAPGESGPWGFVKALEPVGVQGGEPSSRHFELRDRQVSSDAFADACRGEMDGALLPVLRVRRRYFSRPGQALMLLPGYERRNRNNAGWQALMRQAMIGASGTVVVTDATRLASQAQQEIVKDMMAGELKTMRPLIVVTKTEGMAHSPEKQDELRLSAIQAFALEGEDILRRVVCAGTDKPGLESYVAQWRPILGAALRDMELSGTPTRQVQLARLEGLLQHDLQEVLTEVRARATLFAGSSHDNESGHETMQACLEAFDEACDGLREKHQFNVGKLLDAYHNDATKALSNKLKSDYEGLVNKVAHTFDTVTETQDRLSGDVRDSWEAAGSLTDRYVDVLGKLTAETAGPASPGVAKADAPRQLQGERAIWQRLGYLGEDDNAVSAPFTDPRVQENLQALLRSRAGKVETVSNRMLEKTAQLLPAMVLEYTRIAVAFPLLVGVDPRTGDPIPECDLAASAETVRQQMTAFSQVSRALLRGIAVVMAVDVASDGHADILNALLTAIGVGGGGGSAAAASLTIGGAVTGVVAVGYLVHSINRQVRHHDGQVRSVALGMLGSMRDQHLVHFDAHFDALMRTMRDHLRSGLRSRYGLDQRLMEQDRLAKALADVRILRRDMLSHLVQSGRSMVLFEDAAA